MDSLAVDKLQSSSSETKKSFHVCKHTVPHSLLSPIVNGGGCYLLSLPTSTGALSIGSSYGTASPPFSPVSSLSLTSSGSFTVPSPNGGPPDQSSSQPPVPVCSTSYNIIAQRRTVLPHVDSIGAGFKDKESPKLHRKILRDTPQSLRLGRSGLDCNGSENLQATTQLSSTESLSCRTLVPSSPRLVHKIPTYSSPSFSSSRTRSAAMLPERPSSPLRELADCPLSLLPRPGQTNQLPVDSVVHIFQDAMVQHHPLSLQPPISPRMVRMKMDSNVGRGGGSSIRELQPLSPSMDRTGVHFLLGVLPEKVPTLRTPNSNLSLSKFDRESYRLRSRSGPISEDPTFCRGNRACSPSPTSLRIKGGVSRAGEGKASFGTALSPALSLDSLSVTSPVTCPRAQRKVSPERPHADMRQWKNSITEISDNEDKLLKYHRQQREERLREQEMERLVSDGFTCGFTRS